MRLFAIQGFARLALFAALLHCALACGSGSDHAPPIGSPTGPIDPVINEGGNGNGTGGRPSGTSAIAGATTATNGIAGSTFDGGRAGANQFGIAGSGNAGGTAGSNAFGSGGFGTGNDPFGSAGRPSASSGGSFF